MLSIARFWESGLGFVGVRGQPTLLIKAVWGEGTINTLQVTLPLELRNTMTGAILNTGVLSTDLSGAFIALRA